MDNPSWGLTNQDYEPLNHFLRGILCGQLVLKQNQAQTRASGDRGYYDIL